MPVDRLDWTANIHIFFQPVDINRKFNASQSRKLVLPGEVRLIDRPKLDRHTAPPRLEYDLRSGRQRGPIHETCVDSRFFFGFHPFSPCSFSVCRTRTLASRELEYQMRLPAETEAAAQKICRAFKSASVAQSQCGACAAERPCRTREIISARCCRARKSLYPSAPGLPIYLSSPTSTVCS